MSLAQAHQPSAGARTAVRMADDVPARIVYRDNHYRVSDIPTRLESEAVFFVPTWSPAWRELRSRDRKAAVWLGPEQRAAVRPLESEGH